MEYPYRPAILDSKMNQSKKQTRNLVLKTHKTCHKKAYNFGGYPKNFGLFWTVPVKKWIILSLMKYVEIQ